MGLKTFSVEGKPNEVFDARHNLIYWIKAVLQTKRK
jgi:hypothetical protein